MIARELEFLTGIAFKRNLKQTQVSDECDLVPSDPDWPFACEIKFYGSGNGCKREWKEQASRAAAKIGKIPCAIYKYNRQPIRVAVPLNAIHPTLPSDEWAEITLPGLAYLAREIMAAQAMEAA